jgi:limonene-1,2-epoxide hydrolase
MSPEEVVATFIAAIERGDVDEALKYVAPDCEYDNVPVGKDIGVEAIRRRLTAFVSPENPPQFTIVRQAASGNLVLHERVDRLRAGGREIVIAVAGVWEIDPAAGKIKLWRDYFDTSRLDGPPSSGD